MKKNTNQLYILISFLLIAGMTSSCKKILEQEPRNSTYAEVYWQSVRDCESAIAGNYSLLRAAFAKAGAYTDQAMSYYMYGDAATTATSYFAIRYTGDGLDGIQGGDFTFQYNVQSLGDWTALYKAVTMSNVILKNVPQIKDELLAKNTDDVAAYKNKIMGQALFIRALAYFELTKVWGDVPLVTEAYDDPINAPQLPRSDKALVMKQIEDDCHQAMGMLKWGYEDINERAVTANRGSVYALLAHLYLWRATTTNLSTSEPVMEDVNSADTTLQALINLGGYTLQDTAKYGQQFIGRSVESIFEINMSENTQEGSSSNIGLGFLTEKYVKGYGTNPVFSVPDSYGSVHYSYPREGDGYDYVWDGNEYVWMKVHAKGMQYFITNSSGELEEVDVSYLYYGYDGYLFLYDNEDTDNNEFALVGGISIDANEVRYRNNFDGTVCTKYSNIIYRNPGTQTDGYLSNNMIIFRLSDMKLLQAEVALYKNNLPAAADVINFFRDRYNSHSARVTGTDTKESLMYEYILERGKEMYLEGQLYFDLIRTREFNEFIPWMKSRFAAGGFFWPVNPALFKDNKFLTQTAYWRGKI
ncbi:MAG: RagB/SusD family nutrient uptake outer membrane protein [Agriterribacter sp.]